MIIFAGDENRKISREKVKFLKLSTESEIFFENRGNLKQRGNASWSQRGWTPLMSYVQNSMSGCKYMTYILSLDVKGSAAQGLLT